MSDQVSKLGLDIETAGLAKGEKSLDAMANAADRVEVAAAGAADAIANTGQKAAAAATATDKQTSALDRLGENADAAKASIAALGSQTADVASALNNLGMNASSAVKRVSDAVHSQDAALREAANSLRDINTAQASIGSAGASIGPKLKVIEGGLSGVAKAGKLTSYELLNVGNQFQDLGVQIASGGNPLTALIQQGSQLSQVFATAGARGIGFGGVISSMIGSLGGLVVAAAPAIAVIAALGSAFLLADREMKKGVPDDLTKGLDLTEKQLERIKKSGESTSVTMGDSFKGLFMTIGDYAVKAGDAILKAFGVTGADVKKVWNDVLDWFVHAVSNASATVYGLFKGGFSGFVQLWKTLPSVLGDVFVTTFNAIGKYVSGLFNQVTSGINSLIKSISSITGLKLPEIPVFNFQPLENQFAGAGKKVINAFADGFTSGKAEALNAQSQFMKDWAANSVEAGQDRLKKVAGDAGKAAADSLSDNFRRGLVVDKALADFGEAFRKGMVSAMQKGKAIIDAALKDINSRLAESGGQKLFLANVGSVNSYDNLKALLDYQQAYENVVRQTGTVNQSLIDDEYKRLYAVRLQNEEYERQLKGKLRLQAIDKQTVTDNALDGLTDASDQFWHDFASGSKDTFRNLGANLKDIFTEVASKGLQAGFEPVLKWLKDSMTSVFTDIFSSIKDGFTDLLKKTGVLKSNADGSTSLNTDSLIGKTIKAASSIYAGYQIGSAGANAIGMGGKSAANQQNSQAGGVAGSVIGSFFGGPIGSAIGSFIGSVIGGLLGPKSADNRAAANLTSSGAINGSIFGKPTDETSQALTSAISAITSGYDALKQLGGTINATITSLHIGNRDKSEATLSNGQTVNAGSVGDAADLANDALLAVLKATTFTSEALNKVKDAMLASGQSFNDTAKAISSVKGILDAVGPPVSDWAKNLKTIDDVFKPLIASTGQYSAALQDAYNTAKNALKNAFNSDIAGQISALTTPFASAFETLVKSQASRLSDVKALGGDISAVLKLNDLETRALVSNMGSAASGIGDLNAQLQAMMSAAQAAGQSVNDVWSAFTQAKNVLRVAFNDQLKSELLAITSPVAAQFTDLLNKQAQRISNAQATGANMNWVKQLNSAELNQFIDSLSNTYDNITDLKKAFDALVKAAQDAGQSTAALTAAYEANKATLRNNFDTTTSSAIDQLANPTLASLKALLKTQQDRLANATALGANIVAAERLNAMETKDFFDKLTDQQKLSLGDYLGLVEDYTGKIGVVLAQLNDQLSTKIDEFEKTKTALQDTISAFTDIAKSIGDTRQSIIDKYSGQTPSQNVTSLEAQFRELSAKAIGGDQAAGTALPDLANKLIEASRGLYGSTERFVADYNLVTEMLGKAQTGALGQVDLAQSQLDTLIKQYDLLSDIRDILQSGDPNLDALALMAGQLDANNSAINAKLVEYLDYQSKQVSSGFTADQLATALAKAIIQPTTAQSPATTTTDLTGALAEVAVSLSELSDQSAAASNLSAEQLDNLVKNTRETADALKALLKAA